MSNKRNNDLYVGDNEIIYGPSDVVFSDLGYCDFVIDKQFDHQLVLPTTEQIRLAEIVLDVTFGDQLFWLLSTYGSVACGGVETLCLLQHKGLESSFVQETLRFRRFYKMPKDMVAFYVANDNFVYCCNELDMVYEYSLWWKTLTPTHLPLKSFLVKEGLESLTW